MAMVDNSIYGETFLSFLTAVSITWVVLVSKKYDERDFGLNFSVLAEALWVWNSWLNHSVLWVWNSWRYCECETVDWITRYCERETVDGTVSVKQLTESLGTVSVKQLMVLWVWSTGSKCSVLLAETAKPLTEWSALAAGTVKHLLTWLSLALHPCSFFVKGA